MIENSKLMNLEDGKLLYDDLRGRVDLTGRVQNAEVATFNGADGLPLDMLKVGIEPVQDLHGYDNPWVGGAGKNLLPTMSVYGGNTYTTINADGSVFINGTNSTGSATAFAISSDAEVKAGVEYILSGCPSGGGINSYRIDIRKGSGSSDTGLDPELQTVVDIGSGATFTPTTTHNVRFAIRVAANATVSNKTFYPMLRLSSVTDATYAPYENKCPITGHTQAVVSNIGKNLLTTEDFAWKNGTGEKVVDHTAISSPILIPTAPGEKFTYYRNQTTSSNSSLVCRLYNADRTYIGNGTSMINSESGSKTITMPDNAYYATFTQFGAVGVTGLQVQVERGDTFTGYASPVIDVKTIIFPSEAGTVYGGTLTINKDGSGVLTDFLSDDDLSTLSWTTRYTGSIKKCLSASLSKTYFSGNSDVFAISENYPFIGYANAGSNFSNVDSKDYGFYLYRINDQTASTVIYIVIDVNSTPTGKIVYEPRTPVTYTLTAQQITSLLINNLWCDTGSVLDLIYRKDVPVNYELYEKAYKVGNATNGNLAGLDSNGNLTDSGKKASDFANASDIGTVPSGKTVQGQIDALEIGKANSIEREVNEPADVVTIADGSDGLPMSVKVSVDAVQDLHGYDNPWPAGGGKNLLPCVLSTIKSNNTTGTWTGNKYSLYGIDYEFTVNDEDYITGVKVSGTATSTASMRVYQSSDGIPAGNYVASGCPASGGSESYCLRLYNLNASSGGSALYDYGSGVSVESTYTIKRVIIQVQSGVTIPTGGIVFYPMIRLSTVTDDTFAPYSNICPISGWDQAKVTGTGKNLIDITTVTDDKTIGNTGAVSDYTGSRLTDYIFVKPNTKYILSGTNLNTYNSGDMSVRVNYYTSEKEWTYRSASSGTSGISFTTDANTYYVRLTFSKTGTNAQLEIGEIASSYENFNGNDTYTIPFTSTNYGGSVTLNKDGSADVVVNRGIYTISEISEIGTSSIGTGKYVTIDGVTNAYYSEYNTDIIFEALKTVANHDRGQAWCGYERSTTSFGCFVPADATVTEVNNAIQGTKVCYKLATPVTYHIDNAGQLLSLLGVNNVFADCGQIKELHYSAPNNSGMASALTYNGHVMSADDNGVMDLSEVIPTAPSTAGTYKLQCVVVDGVPTLSWVADT